MKPTKSLCNLHLKELYLQKLSFDGQPGLFHSAVDLEVIPFLR